MGDAGEEPQGETWPWRGVGGTGPCEAACSADPLPREGDQARSTAKPKPVRLPEPCLRQQAQSARARAREPVPPGDAKHPREPREGPAGAPPGFRTKTGFRCAEGAGGRTAGRAVGADPQRGQVGARCRILPTLL